MNDPTRIQSGDRVYANGKRGTVAYVRMGGPHFATVVAVSVMLDARHDDPTYAGTMYRASECLPIPQVPISHYMHPDMLNKGSRQ